MDSDEIAPGKHVRLVRSAFTGGWCVMQDSVLRFEVAEVLSVETETIDGDTYSVQANLRFPPSKRGNERLFRCATHYLQLVKDYVHR